MQDLGVFAYRIIGQESISSGSALDFIHDAQNGKEGDDTAIVIANLGQLLWHRRGQRALTMASWNGLPRKTGVSNPIRIDSVKNHVRGNCDVKEHINSVFEAVGKLAREDAKIDIIGVGEGAEESVKYLDENWGLWEKKVEAICVGLGFVWRVGDEVQDKKFMDFWGRVCRQSYSDRILGSSFVTNISSSACPRLPHSRCPCRYRPSRPRRGRLQLFFFR